MGTTHCIGILLSKHPNCIWVEVSEDIIVLWPAYLLAAWSEGSERTSWVHYTNFIILLVYCFFKVKNFLTNLWSYYSLTAYKLFSELYQFLLFQWHRWPNWVDSTFFPMKCIMRFVLAAIARRRWWWSKHSISSALRNELPVRNCYSYKHCLQYEYHNIESMGVSQFVVDWVWSCFIHIIQHGGLFVARSSIGEI